MPRSDDTTPPPPAHDLSVWWELAGAWYAPVWLAAGFATAAALLVARRAVRPVKEETEARRCLRDAAEHAFAVLLGFTALGLTYAAHWTLRTHVSVFFFAVGVAFWSSAVLTPVLRLAVALGERSWLRAALPAAVLGLAAWMLFVEPNRVGVVKERIAVPTLPSGSIVKLAHLSDLQTLALSGREDRALELVNAFDPDLVALTGDLTASGQHPVLVDHVRAWLRRLRTRTSVFVVNGDSDPDFASIVRGMPEVTYLVDAGVPLTVNGASLWIAGVDNKRRPPTAEFALGGAPAGAVRILLTHNPDAFLSPAPARAELGLAGHTHGGQVHVPFVGPLVTFTKLGRRYAEGLFRGPDLDPSLPWNVDQMAICPGLGMEGGYAPRVRFLCPPRVMLWTLVGA